MTQIISLHSFLRGTGRSSLAANVTALLAIGGQRVGAVDTDFQSPSLHLPFGLKEEEIIHPLNDYLWGRCGVEQTAYDVSQRLGLIAAGSVFLVPASSHAGDGARVFREGYDPGRLHDGFQRLSAELDLDALVIDIQAGLSEATLPSIAISDGLGVVLRLDQQDYQGTAVTIDVARKLEVPRVLLIVNQVAPAFDLAEVKGRVEATYQCEVAAVLPYSDEMQALDSAGIFALRYPDHPMTAVLKQVTTRLAMTHGQKGTRTETGTPE